MLNITKEMLTNYLNTKYNPVMTDKIVEYLDFPGEEINYFSYFEKINAKLLRKSHRE